MVNKGMKKIQKKFLKKLYKRGGCVEISWIKDFFYGMDEEMLIKNVINELVEQGKCVVENMPSEEGEERNIVFITTCGLTEIKGADDSVNWKRENLTYERRCHGYSSVLEYYEKMCIRDRNMEDVEIRLAPDETAYIINLTGTEVEKVLEATPDSAETVFETSVSCIGASICQVGLRDSQALLHACVEAVRKAEIPNGALPQIHISGCPSSCGTHQTGVIGFRGAVKRVDDQMKNAFVLFANGEERQGEERMGREIGTMEEAVIPQFLVELGQTVAASGMDYKKWAEKNPQGIDAVAANYL